MCEVIVVTSGKGGVGKTTTSANIGTGLASLGNRVVMIDTDIGLRNLDVVLGLENRIVYNLIDVIEGNCRYKQALIKARNYNNLYLLPCAQTRDKTAVSPEQIDLSLVGTRPPLISEVEQYEMHHKSRLATKPGITGMWQVSGRSDITDFEEVVRLDTEYIENWSFGLDVKIVLKTIKVVLGREGSK